MRRICDVIFLLCLCVVPAAIFPQNLPDTIELIRPTVVRVIMPGAPHQPVLLVWE